MDHLQGIITVVDQDQEYEDEALVRLRQLPKFEPLVVPESPSHFSLANVFGALSTSSDPKHEPSELAYYPPILADILLQMNTHSKKCAQDIQEYQRSLAVKMTTLDACTLQAVTELSASQQQAKTHSDQLLSVHALTKQAQVAMGLLKGILSKLDALSEHIPDGDRIDRISKEKYPHLHLLLHQNSRYPAHPPQPNEGVHTTGRTPSSGLALLAQHQQSHRPLHPVPRSGVVAMSSPSARSATALSIPKARASMALVSNSMNFLPGHTSNADSEIIPDTRGATSIPRSRTADSLQDLATNHQAKASIPSRDQSTLKASDNLRKLNAKSPTPSNGSRSTLDPSNPYA